MAQLSLLKKWRCRRHCCHSNVAGATAVVPAHFVSHLQFANRNEDLAQQCQKRRLRLRSEDSVPYAAALFPQTSFKGAQYRKGAGRTLPRQPDHGGKGADRAGTERLYLSGARARLLCQSAGQAPEAQRPQAGRRA